MTITLNSLLCVVASVLILLVYWKRTPFLNFLREKWQEVLLGSVVLLALGALIWFVYSVHLDHVRERQTNLPGMWGELYDQELQAWSSDRIDIIKRFCEHGSGSITLKGREEILKLLPDSHIPEASRILEPFVKKEGL